MCIHSLQYYMVWSIILSVLRGKPAGKIHFSYCACAVWIWLTSACVFVTKTMAVPIFPSAKLANFGGIFFPIVHLFHLGSNGFWQSKFLCIDSCENYLVLRGVQRNCIFWMLISRPNIFNHLLCKCILF